MPCRGFTAKAAYSSATGYTKPGEACTQCHHDYQERRNIWQKGQPVEKCQACHGPRPEARRLDVKNAYHRQCKGCHLRLRQQGRQAGPVECQACHRPN